MSTSHAQAKRRQTEYKEIFMPARLVSIDEGPDIVLDRPVILVGRDTACDARLHSLRVSRRHCCMTLEEGSVLVRDLASTNGIQINGTRVDFGRLGPGDQLSIAHCRYRFEDGRDSNRSQLHATPA
jgi:pSer/pThr/pTyr-binding forkhead associated (FHA) protein